MELAKPIISLSEDACFMSYRRQIVTVFRSKSNHRAKLLKITASRQIVIRVLLTGFSLLTASIKIKIRMAKSKAVKRHVEPR
jgi:hypothetical protein